MASFTVQSPEPFTFSNPSEWPKWKKRFERFRAASNLSSKDEAVQVDTLVYLMGEKADEIFTSFRLDAATAKKYDDVVKRFDDHFVVKKNVIYERALFNSRIQMQGEAVSDFIDDLHKLAETCEYGNLRDELIRDRIVVGVSNRRLSEKLQLEAKLTLESATTIARQTEAVQTQQDEIHSKGLSQSVSRVQVKQKTKPDRQLAQDKSAEKPKSEDESNLTTSSSKKGQWSSKPGQSCYWCGFNKKHKKAECPAKEASCNKCQKIGHFAKVCKGSSVNQVSGCSLESVFVGSLSSQSAGFGGKWNENIQIGGIPIQFKLDTGADVSVIPHYVYLKFLKKRFPRLIESDRQLFGPDTGKLTTIGMLRATFSHNQVKIVRGVYVVKGLDRSLLGVRECEDLQLLKRLNEIKSSKSSFHPLREFPTVFKGLGKLDTPYEIKLKPNAKPFAVYTPRRIPIPLLEKVKSKLEDMVKMGVIEPVFEATEWCAQLSIAPKPNMDIRLCVDLTQLNKSVVREIHQMSSVESALGQLAGAKYFSKMDATSGFWQVPLAKDSRRLTTFVTPFGRYQFNRLPFGITSAPEHFQRKINLVLQGLKGVVVFLDDILVFAPTLEEHDSILREVLERLGKAKVTLNASKCDFGVTSVKYLGHIIDEKGIHPDPQKIEAIVNMKPPSDVTGVRRFMGMVNHLGRFVPHLSEVSQPLLQLTKSDRAFFWGPDQEKAFSSIKNILTTEPILAIYDPSRQTIVSADASSYGLGAALIQLDEMGNRKVIAYASKSLSETEKRYAQIEKEALALTWASERFGEFIIGLEYLIETDHKPLVPIFTSKPLNELTPRLQRFKMRMMRFSFTIKHIPGKELIIADSLSRSPLDDKGKDEAEEDEACIRFVISSLDATSAKLKLIKELQAEDQVLINVRKYIHDGWPLKGALSPIEQKYWDIKEDISDVEGLLMRGNRIVIPDKLRPEMLGRIHEGHLGITKCRARAKNTLWWPGISNDILNLVKSCVECVKNQPHRHEPLIPTKFPTRPWEIVAMDLLKYGGKWYLVVFDFYSRYPEYALLESLTSRSVITHLKSIFARHGIPDIVRTDNGPQFEPVKTSEFQMFAKEWDFCHVTSSPMYPQSNGMAEAAVKILKQLLKKNQDPYKALLEYRSSPISNGFSPAELLMGRKIKTTLPVHPSLLKPKLINREDIADKEEHRLEKQQENYNRRHGVVEKDPLVQGDVVWVKDKKEWATVKEQVAPRSFRVETRRGPIRRNTFHLQQSYRDKIPQEEIDIETLDQSTFQVPLEVQEMENLDSPFNSKAATTGAGHGRKVVTRSGRTVKVPDRLNL